MKNNRKSTYYKAIGSDFGTIRLKGRWFRFSCYHCIKKKIPHKMMGRYRWQGPPSSAIAQAMDGPVAFPCTKNH